MPLPPREDTERSQPSAAWKRAPTGTWPCWYLDPVLLASRTITKKVLFISYPVYGAVW